MFKKFIKKTIVLLFILFILPNLSVFANTEIDSDELSNLILETANSDLSNFPQITSRSYAIFDRNSRKLLFGKEENKKKKMASTTKIMTAIVILENCKLQDIVTVSCNSASTGGSVIGLKKNDKVTVENLLYGLLVCSGNDAAVALAEHLCGSVEGFAKVMNQKATSLGLVNTNFITPHGLDADNHYTTAYELALLTDYALQNKTFAKIVSTKSITITINNYTKQIKNTNALLGSLNGIYGVKTGFTNGAFKCLVTACKREDLDIICVLLGADTSQIRIKDTTKLLEYTFANYKSVNLQEIVNSEFNNFVSNENKKNSIAISKSQTTNLDLSVEELTSPIVPIKKTDIPNLKSFCCFSNKFEAPLPSKTYIGSIYITLDNTLIASSSIRLDNTISRKNLWNNFMILISNIGKFS